MEVYFKNLTDEGVSVEKLVEDLMCLTNDVEGLVKATTASRGPDSQQELATALERIKARCQSIKQSVVAGAQATDQLIHRHPYSSIGVMLGLGILAGALIARPSAKEKGE